MWFHPHADGCPLAWWRPSLQADARHAVVEGFPVHMSLYPLMAYLLVNDVLVHFVGVAVELHVGHDVTEFLGDYLFLSFHLLQPPRGVVVVVPVLLCPASNAVVPGPGVYEAK